MMLNNIKFACSSIIICRFCKRKIVSMSYKMLFSTIICKIGLIGLIMDSHVPGRFLYDIHLDRGALRILFGDSSAWLTIVGFYKVTHLWPRKGERPISLFTTILQSHPDGLPIHTDWYSVCTYCSIDASISYCLLLHRVCCVYQSGNFLSFTILTWFVVATE